MAQFDVHRNPGRGGDDIPFVVVVQSARYDQARTRLVAPLVAADGDDLRRYPRSVPRFEIEGRRVVIDALLMQPVPRSALGPAIASLADDNSAVAIIGAIDDVISRGYG